MGRQAKLGCAPVGQYGLGQLMNPVTCEVSNRRVMHLTLSDSDGHDRGWYSCCIH
jgi:hypothetical protein